MLKTSIPRPDWERIERAVLPCMGKDDVRYYLNGALIHNHEGKLRFVATNGHRASIVDTDVPAEEFSGGIVERDAWTWAKKMRTKAKTDQRPVRMALDKDGYSFHVPVKNGQELASSQNPELARYHHGAALSAITREAQVQAEAEVYDGEAPLYVHDADGPHEPVDECGREPHPDAEAQRKHDRVHARMDEIRKHLSAERELGTIKEWMASGAAFPYIDGRFPDYMRVFPDEVTTDGLPGFIALIDGPEAAKLIEGTAKALAAALSEAAAADAWVPAGYNNNAKVGKWTRTSLFPAKESKARIMPLHGRNLLRIRVALAQDADEMLQVRNVDPRGEFQEYEPFTHPALYYDGSRWMMQVFVPCQRLLEGSDAPEDFEFGMQLHYWVGALNGASGPIKVQVSGFDVAVGFFGRGPDKGKYTGVAMPILL